MHLEPVREEMSGQCAADETVRPGDKNPFHYAVNPVMAVTSLSTVRYACPVVVPSLESDVLDYASHRVVGKTARSLCNSKALDIPV